MAEDEIVQKIKIETEGGDKAVEQYKAVGKAAEEAAGQITKAGEGGGDGFEKAAAAATKATDGFTKVGEAAEQLGTKLSEISGDKFSDLSESITKFGETTQETFQQAGEAVQQFSEVGQNLDSVGTAIGEFATKAEESGRTVTELGDRIEQTKENLADAATATDAASDGLTKIGDKAATARETLGGINDVSVQVVQAFNGIEQAAVQAFDGLQRLADIIKAVGENLGQIAEKAQPAAEGLAALGEAGGKAAEGLTKAGESTKQVSIEVVHSGEVTQDATQFWALFALEVVKTGVQIANVVSRFGELADAAANTTIKVVALAGALAVVVGIALTPHIQEQANALVKLEIEYRNSQTELQKLALETAKFDAASKESAETITKSAEAVAKVADVAAKAAEGIAKVAEAAKGTGSAFAESGLEGAKLYESLSNLSKATGQTIDNLQVGQQTFEHINVSAKAFGDTVLSIKEQLKDFDVGRAMAASAREVEAATDKVDAANKRVLETQKALLEAQIKLEQSGGARAPYDAAQRLADINRELLKLSSDRVTAEKSVRDAQNATADAADAAAEAQKAQAKAVATSLGTVVEQIRAVIAGQKDIKFDEAVTAERKITAIKVALSEVSQQAGASGVDVVAALVQIIAKTVDLKDALAIGKQFGLDEAAVRSIREYGDSVGNVANTLDRIPNLFQQIRAGGVAIGPEAAANFDQVKTSSEGLEDASLRLQKAWDALFPPTQKLEDFKTKSIELAKAQAEEIARQNELKANWINLGAAILEVGTKIGTTIVKPEFWTELGGKIAELGGKFRTFFSTVAEETGKLGGKFGSFFTGIGEAFTKLAQDSGITGMWDRFTEASRNAFDVVKQLFAGSAIGSMWSTFVSMGQAGLQALSDWWNDKSPSFWDKFSGSFQQAISSLGSGISTLNDVISGKLGPVWDGFSDSAQKALGSIGGFFSDLGNTIGNWTSETWGKFSSSFQEMMDRVKNSVKQWADDVGLTAFWNRITEEAGKMWDAVGEFFVKIGDGFKKLADDIGLTDLWGKITAPISEAVAKVEQFWEAFKAAALRSVATVVDALAKIASFFGASDTSAGLKNWADSLRGMKDAATATADEVIASAKKTGEAYTDTANNAKDASDKTTQAVRTASQGFQPYNAAVNEATKGFQTWGDEGQKAGQKAADGVRKGTTAVDEYKQQLASINDLIRRLSSTKEGKESLAFDIPRLQENARHAGQAVIDAYNQGLHVSDPATFDIISKNAELAKQAAEGAMAAVHGPDVARLQENANYAAQAYIDAVKSGLMQRSPGAFEAIEEEADRAEKALADATGRVKIPTLDWKPLTAGSQKAAQVVSSSFKDVKAEPRPPDWSKVTQGAQGAGEKIASDVTKPLTTATDKAKQETEQKLSTVKVEFKGTFDFNTFIQAAEKAAREIEGKLSAIKPEFKDELNFSALTEKAQEAADKVKEIFSGIELEGKDFSGVFDFEDIVQAAEDAAQSIADAFSDIDISGTDFSEAMSFEGVVQAAEDAAQSIEDAFGDIDISGSNFSEAMSFEDIVQAAEDAASSVEGVFNDIDLSGFSAEISFDTITSAAETAAGQVTQTFQAIDLSSLSAITADFSGVIAAANAAVEQIKTAFQSIGTEGVAALVTSVQQAFEQISQQVQTTAQGISAAFSAIDFSGLINQIGQVVTAFQAMEAAAYAAAQASREAAAAAASAAVAGSRRYGGLFRGLPGNDTNLVWLTDMEFVMRPEAVAKYGIGFMDMINSMTFPTGGYREGGLHRVMHSISAFRDGGLNARSIMIPAFRAGGVNEGNGNGNGKDRSANMRPLNLTIGAESFKGLLAPEDTAKAMERASVGRQLTATGTRPRWNK